MNSYATITDYEERYGTVKESDKARIETLLKDATTILISMGTDPEPDEQQLQTYIMVTCAMVHRVALSPSWAKDGITQHSQTAGNFSETFSFSNPNGDLYLTKNEKKLLGIGNQILGSIPPMTRRDRQKQ